MKDRVLTGIAIFFIAVLVIFSKIILGTTIVADLFIGSVVILASIEMTNILSKQNKKIHSYLIIAFPVALFTLLYISMALTFSLLWTLLSVLFLIILFMLISFCITTFSVAKTENEMRELKIRTTKSSYALKKTLYDLLGFIYPSILLLLFFPINHLAGINYLFNDNIENVETVSVILCSLCFIIPFICDTFAYVVGKIIGGKKIAPKISPKKTIAGSIGGIVFTMLILEALFILLSSIPSLTDIFTQINFNWWLVLLIGFVGSLICEIGDLFESLLKRKANLKDASNFLPGHGGILDRADGFAFVIPFIFIVMIIIV